MFKQGYMGFTERGREKGSSHEVERGTKTSGG
jgi:hypothetical protein